MPLETQHYVIILAVLLTLREVYQHMSPETTDAGGNGKDEGKEIVIEEPGHKLGSISKTGRDAMQPEVKFLFW